MDYSNEISYKTSRSSGGGGQHVNKVSTRVELIFNVDESDLLTENQKERIRKALHNRINKRGELILASQEHRSQKRNKEEVTNRFYELIQKALRKKKKRKKTSIPKKAKEKRLENKKQRSEIKKSRKKPKPPRQ